MTVWPPHTGRRASARPGAPGASTASLRCGRSLTRRRTTAGRREPLRETMPRPSRAGSARAPPPPAHPPGPGAGRSAREGAGPSCHSRICGRGVSNESGWSAMILCTYAHSLTCIFHFNGLQEEKTSMKNEDVVMPDEHLWDIVHITGNHRIYFPPHHHSTPPHYHKDQWGH